MDNTNVKLSIRKNTIIVLKDEKYDEADLALLSDEELDRLVQNKQLEDLNSIRSMFTFFAILGVLSLIVGFFYGLTIFL